jgi:hypothetical protein
MYKAIGPKERKNETLFLAKQSIAKGVAMSPVQDMPALYCQHVIGLIGAMEALLAAL